MNPANQKKLLILSGIAHMVNVVETAKKMGYYTIVTGNVPGSPAKKVADKYYDISTADIDQLAEMAKQEQIDGVFNGFDDLNTWNALALCEKLGLPYYATKEQLEICSNKDQFKAHCRKFGVPVSEEYEIDVNLLDEDIAKLTFPVIIKPVDSYASQGITICYSPDELKAGFEKALNCSKSGNAIVERFIDTPYGIMMYYTVQNGEVYLSAVTDRHVHQQFKDLPPLPIAVAFPSMHKERYLQHVDSPIRGMLKGMGIQNGVLMIQALYDKGDFFIYEMGFRISGSQHYTIVEKQTGINLLEMMLDHALGKPLAKYDISAFDNSYIPKPSCNLPILLDNGTIAKVSGLEEVMAMPQVLSFVRCKHEGDVIHHTGSYSPVFGRFNIVAHSLDELHKTIDAIYNTLTITSLENRDMTLVRYQPEAVPVHE